MIFSSTVFLFLFLPALLVLYYLPFIESRRWRNGVLLIFSVGFYAWGEPLFVWAMLASIAVNWALVLAMARSTRSRKAWLVAAIAFDVSLLSVFKYLPFVSENVARLARNDRLFVDFALPIGISFFTFQLMSYVFDVYYGKAAAQKNPFNLALYISLFPQLVMGPIVRYDQIAEELVSRRDSFLDQCGAGMRRFVYGLGKKVLIADLLGQLVDNAFTFCHEPSACFAWLGALAFGLQIYFDFSGYSDMAIGLGQMFGFHFPENFNYPYLSWSVTEFWRRWHISLSSWFRDYVYIPLGGNRVSKPRWIGNLLFIWFLTGIWHGANWTYVAWGLIYFAALLVEKLTGFGKKRSFASYLWTFLIVVVDGVFFRAAGIASGWRYAASMFGVGASGFVGADFVNTFQHVWLVFILGIVGSTPLLASLFRRLKTTRWNWVEYAYLFVVFCLSIFTVVGSDYNPFIYFNF